ncbi:MAG: hypothetical protein WCC90_20830 [Methylocella sp.]
MAPPKPEEMAPPKPKKVEIVVIGDVYWDTVIIPLPSNCTDENRPHNDYARIDRPAGAFLLETLIRKATESDPNIEVNGYGKISGYIEENQINTILEHNDLKPDKWRRALTVLQQFSKGDQDQKEKVCRIGPKQRFGWVTYPGVSGRTSASQEAERLVNTYLMTLTMV